MPKHLTDVRETRRAMLAALIDEVGQQPLAEMTGIAPSYLWQMAKGEGTSRRGVSDDNALKIELAVGRPPGWLSGEGSVQGQSHATRLTGDTLRNAITLVQAVLKSSGVTRFDVVEDANEVAQAMNWILARNLGAITSDNVLDFMQARAERMNERTGGTGQADGHAGPEGASTIRKQSRTAARNK